jgi:hypothetical protein
MKFLAGAITGAIGSIAGYVIWTSFFARNG